MSSHPYSNTLNLYEYNKQINSKILHICSEFLEFLELNFFSYGFYEDQSHFTITTNVKFLKYIFSNRIFSTNCESFQKSIIQTANCQTKAFIYTGDPKDQLQKSYYNFNIYHYTTFINRKENKVYWWTFGTNRENFDILNKYIEKKTLFENFIKYFNQASSDFISHDNKLKIIHPNYNIPSYNSSYDEASQKFQAKLLKATHSYTNRKFYLTKRELECIKYLAQGRTAKEIAKLLNLSFRTIETYLQNARLRLNCSSRSRLIDLFKEYYS